MREKLSNIRKKVKIGEETLIKEPSGVLSLMYSPTAPIFELSNAIGILLIKS